MKRTKRHIRRAAGWGFILLLLFTLTGQAKAQACVQPPAGLVSWWPGDGNANDMGGSNNNGTLADATFDPAGMVGQAFSFDGLNDFVAIPNSATLNPGGSFSIDAWVYPRSNGPQIIVAKWGDEGDQTNQRSYVLQNTTTGALNFGISDAAHQVDGAFHTLLTPVGALTLNAWNHVAVVYDQSTGTRKTFVNGGQQASRTDPPITVLNSTARVGIGALLRSSTSSTAYFDGLIDEVEFHTRALSASEIHAVFSAGNAGKCNIEIDIRPGSSPNSINPKSKGVIPVAILTTDVFDATTVDPTTVFFGRTGTEAAAVHSALEDLDGDGDADLILHFKNQATGIECGDTSATLAGETLSEQMIRGSDSVKTVGCE